jgi:hypothetical protein
VQTLLGHTSLATTMIYTHVMSKPAIAVTSPLDRLDPSTGLGAGKLGASQLGIKAGG